ncbi:MAG: aspartate kinase, partial [Calditerricola sp.]|nr:aspartate kinase [Calditerricola sp.]
VVVSAMGHTTDELIDLARRVTDQPDTREMDMLLTTGEQVSIALLTMALKSRGCPAVSLTGWQAGITTEAVHGRARILTIDTTRVRRELEQGKVVVVAGFQGVTSDGEIATLGRGGSDTTAVALAAALGADRCDIYTDVSGVYSADPRVVPTARKLETITYDEMLELAALGAGVLQPRAVECAKKHGVVLTVRSSFTEEEGTRVKEVADMEQGQVVRGVAQDKNVARVTAVGLPNKPDTLAALFTILAEANINVDIIIQNACDDERISVSFSVAADELPRTLEALTKHRDRFGFVSLLSEESLAKVSIVGAGMVTNPGVAAAMFRTLSAEGIPIKMVSTSEIKVSCVIPQADAERAVRALHTAFQLDTHEHVTVHG